jgi:hypothetical protein
MKVLGRGWQYTTYDLGNERVLKRYNSIPVGYAHMFKECFPFRNDPIWKLPGFYKGCKETALDSLKKIPFAKLEPWMMANPRILNALDYEQDKVMPLHDFLPTATTEDGKRTIDSFVDFSLMLVEKNLIDKSFNIANNFALDARGRIVLMDLGELFSTPESIREQIRNRAWAKHYITKYIPVALRGYFLDRMDAAFSR